MKNKTVYTFILIAVISLTAMFLLFSTSSSAQRILPDARAVTECYNTKLKASGKYVNCLLRAERSANRNMVEVTDDDVSRCHELFEQRYQRAEARAAEKGEECPSHGGLAPYQDTIVGATGIINSNNDVKTIEINVEPEDLTFVQDRSLNLNIALKVNGEFNVIWRVIPVSALLIFNEIQWSPVFHIFAAASNEPTSIVDIDTNVVDIALGEDVILLGDLLGSPVTGNNPTGMAFLNNSGLPTFSALAQLLTVLDSTTAITPVYVSEVVLNEQSDLIVPSQEIMLWFEANTEVGRIFNGPRQLSTTIDFADETAATISFSNGQWSPPEFK